MAWHHLCQAIKISGFFTFLLFYLFRNASNFKIGFCEFGDYGDWFGCSADGVILEFSAAIGAIHYTLFATDDHICIITGKSMHTVGAHRGYLV
jgi:hypothetical protein